MTPVAALRVKKRYQRLGRTPHQNIIHFLPLIRVVQQAQWASCVKQRPSMAGSLPCSQHFNRHRFLLEASTGRWVTAASVIGSSIVSNNCPEASVHCRWPRKMTFPVLERARTSVRPHESHRNGSETPLSVGRQKKRESPAATGSFWRPRTAMCTHMSA